MKKLLIILAVIGLISALFATTMIVHTTNGNQEFEISEITSISFSNSITENLVAYYPFNGNANDESWNGNDGVVYGSILAEDRFGNEDSAYEFDGIDDNINSNCSFEFQSDFCISIWAKLDTWSQHAHLINNYRNSSEPYFRITKEDEGFEAESRDTNHNTVTSNNSIINDNLWHMFTYSRSSDLNELKFYIDGTLIENQLDNRIGNFSTSNTFIIGSHGISTRFFDGKIDDIRIYSSALSEEEIQALYHENGWN